MNVSLPLSRRDIIQSRLAEGQQIVAAHVAQEFGISEDAVRRDLRALAAEGKCRRVYGGALPNAGVSQPISERIVQSFDRKSALARAAIAMIQPGEFVFLDSGSTNLALVKLLSKAAEITVATNSIDIAAAAMDRGLPLVLIGGSVNPLVGGSVDASAVDAIGNLNIDRCFVGACAVSASLGIAAYDPADAVFKRALVRRSAACIAMATSEKFAERAPHRIGGPADIQSLVVEHDIGADDEHGLIAAGYALVKAGEVSASR